MDRPRLMNTAEAALFLRLSPKTLQSWRGKERGLRGPRFFRVEGQIRYSVDDLNTWLKAQAVEPKGF